MNLGEIHYYTNSNNFQCVFVDKKGIPLNKHRYLV
ncbi:MAG: hypothetical protein Ct9H90mP22_5910 [Gammaproteobacteria bacterium]|nr:MAG: hypothetical protein Ct9H90mP22_5910 [Gammaproteobacteria bacterium]